MSTLTDPLVIDVTVDCPVTHAFTTFTTRASTWWPPDHTMSGTRGVQIIFESHVEGRVYERAADGTEHEWGRVLVWEPPHRLVYLWHLGTDLDHATEVEVTFTPNDQRTVVHVEHRGWQRLGADARARREANQDGWNALLPAYANACAR